MLSIKQIVIPLTPLMLCYVALSQLRAETGLWSAPTVVKEADGRLVELTSLSPGHPQGSEVLEYVHIYDVWWNFGPWCVTRYSVPVSDHMPDGRAVGRRVLENRNRIRCVAYSVALLLGGLLGRCIGWHSRFHDGSPLVSPWTGLVVSSIGAVALVALACTCRGFFPEQYSMILERWGISSGIAGMAMSVLIGPVYEEFFYRSGLQRLLARWMPTTVAVIVQALYFGACHSTNLLHMAAALFGGLAFGAIYALTNSITVAIVIHGLSNAVFLLLNH